MIMRNSRKQLIAQIRLVEQDLYKNRDQVKQHQHQLSKNFLPILSFVLIVSTLVLFFKSKNSFKKIARTIVGAGEMFLINYFKKQMTQFLR